MRIVAILLLLPALVVADEALIAVASNFNPVLEKLRDDFELMSPHQIELSSGSTGVIYAQIVNGAPYDAFLAADQERPERLEKDGIAAVGSRFTYAEGRLAVWSRSPGHVAGLFREILLREQLRVLAIANPDLAPYGKAAQQALDSVGQWDALLPKIVLGENVGQAFAMVATENADIGIVALSTVLLSPDWLSGSYVEVPGNLHSPIKQDAILLRRGVDNRAAVEFLEFLQSDAAREKIMSYGYQ